MDREEKQSQSRNSIKNLLKSHAETVDFLFICFQRSLSFFFLFYGMFYWLKLIGWHPTDLWRFDLMPLYLKLESATFAIFFPFTAIGLWVCSSWGIVMWFFCLFAESILFFGFPFFFEERGAIMIIHTINFIIWVCFTSIFKTIDNI